MERDYLLKIIYLESVDSTQIYLKNLLKNKAIDLPYAVSSEYQTFGRGSRDNLWLGTYGNLYLSFAIKLSEIPNDLKIESASIYYAYLLKMTLDEFGSKTWIKWPNDFYIKSLKVGGMITNVVNDTLVCGVGLNLVNSPNDYVKLDISIDKKKLIEKYFTNIEKKMLWKQVFSKYRLEFSLNKKFSTHYNNDKISMENAFLNDDGSITINNERIYSLR